MTKIPLILASNSPRRKWLLAEAGYKFTVLVKSIEETWPKNLVAAEIPLFLAQKKATCFEEESQQAVIITADTIVWLDNQILNKPIDRNEAVTFLQRLSGVTHTVFSGVTLLYQSLYHSFVEKTEVVFDTISPEDIDFYVDNYKPYDKAGAYGIQEWIGLNAVREIHGDYFNIMGFPVCRFRKELKQFLSSIHYA